MVDVVIRIKNEPRETLSFDQISSVLAPSALWQTDYPANVVTFMTARNNLGSYYTSCAVRWVEHRYDMHMTMTMHRGCHIVMLLNHFLSCIVLN